MTGMLILIKPIKTVWIKAGMEQALIGLEILPASEEEQGVFVRSAKEIMGKPRAKAIKATFPKPFLIKFIDKVYIRLKANPTAAKPYQL